MGKILKRGDDGSKQSNVFPFSVVVRPDTDREDVEKFMRPFLALREVDEFAAEALRKMAIDFNDHRLFGGGMDYGDWQRSAKRRKLNLKREPGERANGYREDWD